MSKLFGWSVDSGLLESNPMLGVRAPTKEGRGKTRALTDAEIWTLWRALETADALPGIVSALKLILILAQRPGEVAGMATDELHDLDNPQMALWALPAHRMKARRAHVVPLPPLAREIISAELARPHRSGFVFEGSCNSATAAKPAVWRNNGRPLPIAAGFLG